MGWWTLGGRADQPVAERVAGELVKGCTVLRSEMRGEAVHMLVREPAADGSAVCWVVALVRGGMVKIMGEEHGPYCPAPSPAFYAAALEACGEPKGFAVEFRERMRPVARVETDGARFRFSPEYLAQQGGAIEGRPVE
jgi:hypothetical protein